MNYHLDCAPAPFSHWRGLTGKTGAITSIESK